MKRGPLHGKTATYEVQITGEAARARIGVEFRAMVQRLADAGIGFTALAIVAVVDAPEGWLVKTTGCGSDRALNDALRVRIREALDRAADDAGFTPVPAPAGVVQ